MPILIEAPITYLVNSWVGSPNVEIHKYYPLEHYLAWYGFSTVKNTTRQIIFTDNIQNIEIDKKTFSYTVNPKYGNHNSTIIFLHGMT